MKKCIRSILALTVCTAMSLNLAGCSSTVNAATTESSAGAGEAAAGEQTVSLYFVRHGKTILNTLNRVQGWSDSPLTEAGADVAKDTAQGLADISFDLVYASDRMRAMETARIIMDAGHAGTAQQINSMEGLRECNYGKYEGDFNDVMWSDIMAELGVDNMGALMQLEESTKQIYDTVAKLDETGEAESYDEVAGRLMASVEEIVAQAQASGAKNVLVVGHGGAIGVILSKLNGASVGELGNASVSLAEYTDGNYQVISVGDMSYCENGAKLRKSQPETAEEVLKPVEGEETGEVVVYLTRHGKTVFNTMGRTQGWVDSPLTAAGVEVAENLGKGISDVTFAAAYSSDMGRAVETSEIVLGLNKTSADLPLIQMPGLRETNYGKFEGGINTDMLNAALNEMGLSGMEDLNALENGIAAVTDTIHRLDETGEAEDYNTMSARTFGAFDRICKETAVNGGGNVLVVAHGNAIMSILNTIGDANALEIENASVSMIRYSNGTYTIESVNDTSYSEAGALK